MSKIQKSLVNTYNAIENPKQILRSGKFSVRYFYDLKVCKTQHLGKKGPILGLIAFYPPAEVRTIDKSFMTVVEKELVMTRTLLDRSHTCAWGIGI